jgi:hypothetical protein
MADMNNNNKDPFSHISADVTKSQHMSTPPTTVKMVLCDEPEKDEESTTAVTTQEIIKRHVERLRSCAADYDYWCDDKEDWENTLALSEKALQCSKLADDLERDGLFPGWENRITFDSSE